MTDLSLAGPWTLFDTAGAEIGPCPIPGDIHTALIAAGRIPDPMLGTNEAEVQWVAEVPWEIRRSFRLSAEQLQGKWAVLDLEFVDTIADVTVNGQVVAKLDSSFIRHRLDLTKVLRPGDNDIAIRFHPIIAEAQRRAALLPFPIPWSVTNNRVPDLNMVRKAQCHGGCDWGPCLLVMGVYAEPKLRLFDAARIEHAIIRQRHHDDGKVTVTADVELAACRDASVPLTFTFDGQTVGADVAVTKAAGGKAALSIELDRPALWWPAGYGEPPLHDAAVTIPGDAITKKIGLRRMEVINEPDATGTSLTVRVNGLDIFAKGANWVPADALPFRITPERIRRLLGEAVAANMNEPRLGRRLL
jgi:beta-mannosidase